jgi:hypothetical protein
MIRTVTLPKCWKMGQMSALTVFGGRRVGVTVVEEKGSEMGVCGVRMVCEAVEWHAQ